MKYKLNDRQGSGGCALRSSTFFVNGNISWIEFVLFLGYFHVCIWHEHYHNTYQIRVLNDRRGSVDGSPQKLEVLTKWKHQLNRTCDIFRIFSNIKTTHQIRVKWHVGVWGGSSQKLVVLCKMETSAEYNLCYFKATFVLSFDMNIIMTYIKYLS